MAQQCELLDRCRFMINFGTNANSTRQAWFNSFCKSLEKSESCQRKKFFKLHGYQPEGNIAPTGKIVEYVSSQNFTDSDSGAP